MLTGVTAKAVTNAIVPFSFTSPQGVRDERFVSQKQFKLLQGMSACYYCVTEVVAHHTSTIRDVATYARKSS